MKVQTPSSKLQPPPRWRALARRGRSTKVQAPTFNPPLAEIAKDEVWRWSRNGALQEGLVMAILFCFCLRLTTGKTYEETFCVREQTANDYEI